LDQTFSSFSILGGLVVAALVIGFLYKVGLIEWGLGIFGRVTRWALSVGFQVWVQLLSWANWAIYLLVTVGLLAVGGVLVTVWPWVSVCCAAVVLFMGLMACLAYMYIDVERYEVERGRKALHNPMKGQELAANVARYGEVIGIPLLGVSAAGLIAAFALLNQGLFKSIGPEWYLVEGGGQPSFVDFLAYALINLLSLVDVLDLADSRQLLHASFVRKGAWQSAALLGAFRSFFTLILLQQVFASVRQGRLLAETIADFWSPHEPIHHRARNTLPQFGPAAIEPLLVSLGEMTAMTKEQRDQLPLILAAIGPSTAPSLVRHLNDPSEHVRAISASTLGHLCVREATAELVARVEDASELVRLSAVEALGLIAAGGARAERSRRVRMPRRKRGRWDFFRRRRVDAVEGDPTTLAVAALQRSLGDSFATVRCQAAASLGRAGAAGFGAADALAGLFQDPDETVRCRAAEAFGQIGGAADVLAGVLDDPAADVRAAAARGLKSLGRAAAGAVPKLVDLMQDRDEAVRTAATEAVAAAGTLNGDSTNKLAAGLTSPDTVVRAQTAEALGTVGASAEYAAPPLVEALQDSNDVVRAKAAEALGKLGETAAEIAIPSLVRALRDPDSWVSALAAEALGEMGGTSEGAVPGLMRAMSHVNAQVRANSALALGKLGPSASAARGVIERAATDEDGGVRAAAVRALGGLGPPPPSSLALVRAAIADPDPLARAAAVASIGAWDRPVDEMVADLVPLLRDPNDEVKVQVAEVLPRCVGAAASVVEKLAEVLAEDDNPLVQMEIALALAKLGSHATAAGPTLLRIARTGEAGVREQAMRALVMIQPPEANDGFLAGLTDPVAEVRVVASAGWIKAAAVPAAVVPALIEALRDPEVQVRANVAYALGRMESLTAEAVRALGECAAHPNDGLRLNAAVAVRP
jgi:HEAT repeat protein